MAGDHILGSVETLTDTLIQQAIIVTIICLIFLFHARDDTTVPIRQSQQFADQLKKTNPSVTLVTTARGGHHDSMIREGIPKAIAWLQKLPAGGRK